MTACCLMIGLTLVVVSEGQCAPGQATPVRILRDLEYGVAGDFSLKLDAYLPSEPGPHPAVILIHGGGWRSGDKAPLRGEALWYAHQGVAAFSINYRLSHQATYPAAVDDCILAVRWIRAHAQEHDVDAGCLGVQGGSAGGHLALMVGLTEPAEADLDADGQPLCNWVRCVYAKNGPTDFTQPGMASEPHLRAFMGVAYADRPEVYQAASPISHVSSDDPPVLMIHGTDDRTVPYSQSVILRNSLEQAGVPAELITIEGGGHGLRGGNPEDVRAALERARQFMLAHLQAD
jgi:acetyl esterase/lipase